MLSVPKRTATPAGALISMARPEILSKPLKIAMRRTPFLSGTASAMAGV
jgi:hypothetical protein